MAIPSKSLEILKHKIAGSPVTGTEKTSHPYAGHFFSMQQQKASGAQQEAGS
ncbi:MAG: hypothetical protein KHX31_03595 [Akkermansia sp.]|uniref:hypothetical protein n=1 Tax=Akkermansia sp. TaxID=1872421 RepID=UPI0025BDAA51|nr:hypothetical protein [Akkermansia sp.]MBS5507698.1 hypothetical protein [Akkermansia sp.]MCD8063521.1 hypothetical protein [Akkermansia sp.]